MSANPLMDYALGRAQEILARYLPESDHLSRALRLFRTALPRDPHAMEAFHEALSLWLASNLEGLEESQSGRPTLVSLAVLNATMRALHAADKAAVYEHTRDVIRALRGELKRHPDYTEGAVYALLEGMADAKRNPAIIMVSLDTGYDTLYDEPDSHVLGGEGRGWQPSGPGEA